jgi:hypothetical protein
VQPRGDQASEMRHIDHQVRVDVESIGNQQAFDQGGANTRALRVDMRGPAASLLESPKSSHEPPSSRRA